MKKWGLCGIGFLAFLMMTALFVVPQSEPEKQLAEKPEAVKLAVSLPAALDGLYPPQAKEPVFLMKMLGLAHVFSGTLSDLFENDLPNALGNFQKFKAEYGELAGLVPEWKSMYPPAPVEELSAALKSGEQGQIIAAVEKVGGVCSACHVKYMAPVQYRYGWPEFSKIRTKDSLTGEDLGLHQLMVYLDINFSGISNNLQQGQAENAQKQFQAFKARFEAMASICQECHGQDERKYYVDPGVRAMVEELGKAAAEPSPEKAGKLVMGIGMESCHKCHLVHLPPAFAQKKGRS